MRHTQSTFILASFLFCATPFVWAEMASNPQMQNDYIPASNIAIAASEGAQTTQAVAVASNTTTETAAKAAQSVTATPASLVTWPTAVAATTATTTSAVTYSQEAVTQVLPPIAPLVTKPTWGGASTEVAATSSNGSTNQKAYSGISGISSN